MTSLRGVSCPRDQRFIVHVHVSTAELFSFAHESKRRPWVPSCYRQSFAKLFFTVGDPTFNLSKTVDVKMWSEH